MNTNGIIFNSIAAAAKVVFEHLEIAPGTYTAAQIWRALNGSTKEIKSIKVKQDIYNYNWENLGPQFTKKEDNGGIYITVGSFSCGIGPESVFEVLPKFAKIAGLPSAEISAALKFTRDESAGMVPACSFSMPCTGSKLVKCAAADELRPIMNAVCLDPAGYLVASDGHILTVVPATIEIQENAPELRQIPMPADVIKTAKNGEKVDIYTDGKRYVIKTATAAATVDPADMGRYPNWRGCVPSNRKHVATFTKKEFSNLQKTATKITKEINNSFFVYESCNGAARILSYNESKQSIYNATIDAQEVAPAYLGLSAARLSRLVMTGKTIKMYYENQAQSIIFIDDNNILTLLMPCYIENAEEMGINTNEMQEALKHSPAPRVDMPYYYNSTATPKKKEETAEDTTAAPSADNVEDTTAAPAAAVAPDAAAPAAVAIDTTEEDTAADAVASIVADTAAALSEEERAALVADAIEEETAADAVASIVADTAAAISEEERAALFAAETTTAAEETTEDTAEEFAAETTTAAEETTEDTAEDDDAEEEDTTTAPAVSLRPSRLIRAAMWLHRYAAALIVAALPLFVLYCISETETPAAAMMHTTTAAAKIITDAAEDTTAAPAVATLAASPADSVAAPGDTTTAAPAVSHIEKETAAAPSLSPDDLAAMYAAYLAAVEDTTAPVLSDSAEETAEDDTAAAVYLATVHGDFVAVHTAPASSEDDTTAPGGLSTFAATPGAPSIIPAF